MITATFTSVSIIQMSNCSLATNPLALFTWYTSTWVFSHLLCTCTYSLTLQKLLLRELDLLLWQLAAAHPQDSLTFTVWPPFPKENASFSPGIAFFVAFQRRPSARDTVQLRSQPSGPNRMHHQAWYDGRDSVRAWADGTEAQRVFTRTFRARLTTNVASALSSVGYEESLTPECFAGITSSSNPDEEDVSLMIVYAQVDYGWQV